MAGQCDQGQGCVSRAPKCLLPCCACAPVSCSQTLLQLQSCNSAVLHRKQRRTEKTMPFGVDFMRGQEVYWAAHNTGTMYVCSICACLPSAKLIVWHSSLSRHIYCTQFCEHTATTASAGRQPRRVTCLLMHAPRPSFQIQLRQVKAAPLTWQAVLD